MAIDTMKKGSIEMLTLFLLCEEDAYGYQLVQKIKERSKGLITVQEGSFYPLLYRLADDGYITGEEVVTRMSTGRSRMRVIYHIENAGRERLLSLKKDYETVQQVSILFLILNLRTSFHSNPIEKQLLFLTRSSCFFVGKDHSEINRIMAARARRLLVYSGK